ncbi:MAG: hypothetical protein ABF805_08220 [Bifidobacterium sp.]
MGMRRASEHREDRYSSSLHVVTQEDAARVGDTKSHVAGMQRVKGSFMDSEKTQSIAAHKQEHIERIRQTRRAAIRRRQRIVATLAIVTVALVILGATKTISMLYAVIPALLLLAVLLLGAHAAKSARAWELRVAQSSKGASTTPSATSNATAKPQTDTREYRKASQSADIETRQSSVQPSNRQAQRHVRTPSSGQQAQSAPATATDVLNKAEIQRILQLAKQEQQRSKRASEASRPASVPSPASVSVQARTDVAVSKPKSSRASGGASKPQKKPQESAAARKASLPNVDMPKLEQDSQQKAASQDLISFSLGSVSETRNLQNDGPESREIKSSKQVAVAKPKPKSRHQSADKTQGKTQGKTQSTAQGKPQGKQQTAANSTMKSAVNSAMKSSTNSASNAQKKPAVATPHLEDSSATAASPSIKRSAPSAHKVDTSTQPQQPEDETREIVVAGVVDKVKSGHTQADSPNAAADNGSAFALDNNNANAEQFHADEIHAEVEPPTQSSESLSIGLETILSRRGNH